MTSQATAGPPAFTITTLGTEPGPGAAAECAAPRMRLWRRAVITAAAATSPAPVVATVTTGHAGWTPALLLLDIAAVLAAAVSHAHSETAVQWRPEPEPVEISYTDAAGNHVRYTVRPASAERA